MPAPYWNEEHQNAYDAVHAEFSRDGSVMTEDGEISVESVIADMVCDGDMNEKALKLLMAIATRKQPEDMEALLDGFADDFDKEVDDQLTDLVNDLV